jgi:hypothetical protein
MTMTFESQWYKVEEEKKQAIADAIRSADLSETVKAAALKANEEIFSEFSVAAALETSKNGEKTRVDGGALVNMALHLKHRLVVAMGQIAGLQEIIDKGKGA